MGIDLQYRFKKITVGTVSVNHQLEYAFNKQADPYEIFRRADSEQCNTGMYFSYSNLNMNLFGELAQSWNAGRAVITGLTIMPHRTVSMAISYRDYQKDFIPIYSSAFGENSLNQNEKGFYISSRINVTPRVTWSVYADAFSFDWLKYRVSSPSTGMDYFTDLKYYRRKKFEIYFRIRWKEKELDLLLPEENIPSTQTQIRKNVRLQFQYQLNEKIRLRNRIEFSQYDRQISKSNGVMFFQEFKYQKMGWPLSLVLRYSIFETDDYDSRIYSYEQDVPGAYSIPSFSGVGSRYFILIHYRLNRRIDCWVKFGKTIYSNVETIGSGLDEIAGDSKTDIKLQCRLRL